MARQNKFIRGAVKLHSAYIFFLCLGSTFSLNAQRKSSKKKGHLAGAMVVIAPTFRLPVPHVPAVKHPVSNAGGARPCAPLISFFVDDIIKVRRWRTDGAAN